MTTTGFFFQRARGRAMVRTRAMNEARRIRRAMDFVVAGNMEPARRILGRTEVDHRADLVLDLLRARMGFEVGRARRAVRDWRSYRQRARDFGEIP